MPQLLQVQIKYSKDFEFAYGIGKDWLIIFIKITWQNYLQARLSLELDTHSTIKSDSGK